MPLVLKSSWMDTQEGTVDLRQEESLEAVITVLRFLLCETNYQQEIMCGERSCEWNAVCTASERWLAPAIYGRHLANTCWPECPPWHYVIWNMVLLYRGLALWKACVYVCVCIDQGYCYSHGCHWSCAVVSANQPKVQETGSAASCFFLPLQWIRGRKIRVNWWHRCSKLVNECLENIHIMTTNIRPARCTNALLVACSHLVDDVPSSNALQVKCSMLSFGQEERGTWKHAWLCVCRKIFKAMPARAGIPFDVKVLSMVGIDGNAWNDLRRCSVAFRELDFFFFISLVFYKCS